jgi:hypothetical protein
MATLNAGTSLSAVAHILHSAALLSHEAWNGGGASSAPGSATGPGSGDRDKDAETLASEPRLSDDLLQLFTQLKNRWVRHVLVGGVAMLKYIDGRNTDDIDLLMSVESLAHLPEIKIEGRNPDFATGRFRSVRIVLLLTSNPVFRLVQDTYATMHRFHELEVPCATVEGLVLLKLYALPSLHVQGDLQRAALYETDIMMLCQRHRRDAAPILDALRPHVTGSQMDELVQITAEIEQRIRRMNRSICRLSRQTDRFYITNLIGRCGERRGRSGVSLIACPA